MNCTAASSSQAAYRSARRKRQASFTPLLVLSPEKRRALFWGPRFAPASRPGLAHSAVPPLPTRPASLGSCGDPSFGGHRGRSPLYHNRAGGRAFPITTARTLPCHASPVRCGRLPSASGLKQARFAALRFRALAPVHPPGSRRLGRFHLMEDHAPGQISAAVAHAVVHLRRPVVAGEQVVHQIQLGVTALL